MKPWESLIVASVVAVVLSVLLAVFVLFAARSHICFQLSLMSSLKLHPSLPAPVVHASVAMQTKSQVLTGVQDAYWSDEEVLSFFHLASRRSDDGSGYRKQQNVPSVSKRWISLT